MTFTQIQQRAVAEWQALKQSDKPHILVSNATCGQAAGVLPVLAAINNQLAERQLGATVTQIGCIGLCYAEPIMGITKPNCPDIFYGNVTPEIVPRLIADYILGDNPHPELALGTVGEGAIKDIPQLFELPMLKSQLRIVMRNCGWIDPERINHYIGRGGYASLVKALAMAPEEVISEVKKSGLRGRGGGIGFSTGLKWEICRKSADPVKYLICNAHEGDPGTFVDRALLESDPHIVIEGMLIAAYAIGASQGYIYIGDEYPLAMQRLKIALEQVREFGLLGDNILDSGFSFEVEIRRGAGAFVSGEETALIESIERGRGVPRVRPPYPVYQGLWGRPTNVNNVETLANIPAIIEKGGDWYASIGTEGSKGTKLFSLSGNIAYTGVFEVPFGMPLRRLVEEIGGGISDGRRLKALQPGGAMLGLIPASLIDQPIDFEGLVSIGSRVGSGGLVVLDETACVVDLVSMMMSFAYSESCGKCSIGRLGTKQILSIFQDATSGQGKPEDISLLTDLSESVALGSLCPLCGGIAGPIVGLLNYFRKELEAHIIEHHCPAGVCQALAR